MDTEDCLRPANGLLYRTMKMEDGVMTATDDELRDNWASDEETIVFEEFLEFQGNLPEERNDLRLLTMLTVSFARTVALRVESVVLRCIQHHFQIGDPLLLRISIRGSIIILLAHFMLTTLKEVLLGLKALLMLLGCACLICNLF